MIWGTFLGAGLVLRFGGHVAIDNPHQRRQHAKRPMHTHGRRRGRGPVLSGDGVFSVQYVWATRFRTTAATDVPMASDHIAMPVGFGLMLCTCCSFARSYIAAGSYVESARWTPTRRRLHLKEADIWLSPVRRRRRAAGLVSRWPSRSPSRRPGRVRGWALPSNWWCSRRCSPAETAFRWDGRALASSSAAELMSGGASPLCCCALPRSSSAICAAA